MKLKNGVATIQFASGAEVVLEAPAHVMLETPMRAKLLEGSAIITVPEPAIGFIMDTPHGYAVDHGTQFSVSVDPGREKSAFEVLSGEISVHHPDSDSVQRLHDAEGVLVQSSGLSPLSQGREDGILPARTKALRLGTEGREITVIRSDLHADKLHPDFLMAKRSSIVDAYDRRSLFGFDLSAVKDLPLVSARLYLNQVPCGLGFAARLPEESIFAVYGIATGEGVSWPVDALKWGDAPQPASGTLLGKFAISRGHQSGIFGPDSPELVAFLEANRAAGEVQFLLVRETDESEGNGLVHAFASSRHPVTTGPTLELNF
jgi:hypothetical protein